MSINIDPLPEIEQTGERFVDHIASEIPTLAAILQTLAGKQLVIRISLEDKQP